MAMLILSTGVLSVFALLVAIVLLMWNFELLFQCYLCDRFNIMSFVSSDTVHIYSDGPMKEVLIVKSS